jgi:ASPIC and UnbV/FG-GAP-like repeat
VIAGVAIATAIVISCSDSAAPVADGADVDRPVEASMASVRLTDVAAEVGLDFRHGAFQWGPAPDPNPMMGGGVCWIDYDRDGWLDLFAVNTWTTAEWGRWRAEGLDLPASRMFRNDAGRFVDVSDDVGARIETRGNGCVAADLDLDGWTDLYVTTERNNVLLWNDDGERFVDDTTLERPSGTTAFGWHSGAAVGDVDGDGWPDLYVAGYADMNRPVVSATKGFPNTHQPEPDLLYLNEGPIEGGRVAFREAAAATGIEPAGPDYALGAVLSDLDRDGDLDLYVAHDTTPNQLYENRLVDDGTFEFVEVGASAGVDDTGAGMGVASGDFDGDGRFDLVTTNQLDELDVLVRNVSDGALAFDDARADLGVGDLGSVTTGWGTAWIDIDLDTDLDLLTVNGKIPVRDLVADREPLLLHENRDGASLVDARAAVGLDGVGPLLARGAAPADYDNDGDVDVAIGTIGGDLVLLRNTGAGGTWLTVSPAPATAGVVVSVELGDGRTLERELQAGSSYLSSADPRAHFGLGGASEVTAVTVRWPDGTTIVRDDIEVDRILEIDRDDA